MHRYPQISGVLFAIIAGGPLTGSAQVTARPPLNAKVQETLMGPVSRRVVMSEDGDHLAIVTPKGSREIVLIDGVEGPVFDEIPERFGWGNYGANGGPIGFSPTGGRSAYVGRRAGDYIAVVDGKEAVTLMTPATAKGISYTEPAAWRFSFSRDGSRLAFAAREGTSWVMVVDGVKSPSYQALDMTQAELNGKRLIYVAQTPGDQKWHAVVDGKVGPAYDSILSLKVTPDGAHYAYIISKRTATARSAAVVIDGVEGATEREISDLEQAPDGRVAYMAMRPQTGPGGNPPHLIAGGLDLTWTTTFGYPVPAGPAPQQHVAWSADGKRFATIQQNMPNPGVTVLVNGKAMGQSYAAAANLSFSPDGSRFFYVGNANGSSFPVLDGQELPSYGQIVEFRWSPDGTHYALVGFGNPAGYQVVVDGKVQPKVLGYSKDSFSWSPDSKHFAYGAQNTVSTYVPVLDGATKPGFLGNFFAINRVPRLSFAPLLFSADGTHLAYVAQRNDGTGKASVYVDAQSYEGPTPSHTLPSFSPDGKHFATIMTTGTGWLAMVDGKLGPSYEEIVPLNLGCARFLDNHTYRFYGIKAGQIYRVTLDVGP
jgi:hypothetical protein